MTKTPPLLRPVLAILSCSAAITGTSPIWGIPGPVLVYQRPIDAMVDVTNDLGVAVLQDYAYTRSNFVFSPYGVVSVLVVLYEGARGESARQIHNVLRLPWNRDVTRIGFRDIHRHLRGYFSHEGYLSGLTLNKLNTSLLPEYRRVLRFYGYDVGLADEHGPFPPRKPTTTTTTASPETEPQTPTIIQGTIKPVGCQTTTEQTTLVSEETTMGTTTSEPPSSTTAPEETSPTTPVTVGETSGFTTTMETSTPTTVTETTLTDATKAEETPSTILGSSTTTAAETILPEQPISSTLPSTLEQTTTVVENTDTTFMGTAEDTSSPTIAGETSTIEAATTKAAILPTQPITSTVPTSLEEITTITQGTEPVFTGAEDTSSVTESSTDDATTNAEDLLTQPDTTTIPTSLPEVTTIQGTESGFAGTEETSMSESSADDATTKAEAVSTAPDTTTIPTSLPEVTTIQGTESGFPGTEKTSIPESSTTKAETLPTQPDRIPTDLPEVTTIEGITDAVKDILSTTVVDTTITDDAETTVAPLSEQTITSTAPTTLEDTIITQTTTSTFPEAPGEYTSPTTDEESSSINPEGRAAFLPEQPTTSTIPNSLKEITTVMDSKIPVVTDVVEDTSLPVASVETSTADAEIVPELSIASTIPTTLEQITTAMENAELAAARLQLSTPRTSSVVKKETTNIPMENLLTNYSGDSSPDTKMVAPTNASTVFIEGTSLKTEMAQQISATSEDTTANMSTTESLYKHKSEDTNEVVDVEVVTEVNKGDQLAPSQESEHKNNFMLELASLFTEALGAVKNESAHSTKRGAKVDNADMSAKEEIKSNGSSVSWDNTMTNESYKMPSQFTDKTREKFGEMPSVNHSRSRRSVADERVVFFPDISLQLQNGMFDSQVARGYDLFAQLHRRPFLIDGATEELVPMMSYTSVFQYAYIQSLHAQALEFPLDDERYKLLILLPVERRGLRQLIYDLNSCPLRTVFEALKPTRVQAIIPSFMVEGFVILTPTLQQLGVWDVFDPRRADLSGMSSDPELYVRNIEQAVTVVIRNYVKILDIQTRTLTARTMLQLFAATHPFLYFVVDTETHVSLMAGKMVDPLNSRIY